MLKLLYWLAVLAVSVALVVVLILFLESRDKSSLKQGAAGTYAGRALTSRANTTIR